MVDGQFVADGLRMGILADEASLKAHGLAEPWCDDSDVYCELRGGDSWEITILLAWKISEICHLFIMIFVLH